jgi:L-lactate dehydrogenase complex protein LldE
VKVALFITCLTDSYFPRAGIAVVKVLEHLGHTVEFPQQQTCCGQPMFNNGFRSDARELALRMIDVFEPYETVVTPSGSCAAMIREHYGHLFEGDAHGAARAASLAKRTFEFSEFLANVLHVDLRELGVKWEGDVTAHSACHLRGLGLTGVTEGLLGGVSGLNLVPLGKVEQCCGFGGTFSVKMPEISGGMVAEKVAHIKATGCRTVVCNEAGCGMNIAGACRRAGAAVGFTSLAEIIAEGLGLMPRQEQGS